MADGYRYPGGLTSGDFADGNTSAGWQPSNFAYGSKITIDANGTVTSMGVRGDGDGGTSKNIKIALFDSAGNLVDSGTLVLPASPLDWVDTGTLSIAVTTGTHYVLVSADNDNTRYGYSSTANGIGETVAYASFPPSSISTTEDETGTLFGVRLFLVESATRKPTMALLGAG